jgi:hypothetical protein
MFLLPRGRAARSESRAQPVSTLGSAKVRSALVGRALLASLVAVAALVSASLGLARATGLVLPTHTPGVRYSKVTQATIHATICVKGWTKTIRPPSSYTTALKKAQLVEWNYADKTAGDYEEDHLISLELGGAPWSKKNLWPEPWSQARRDDNGIEASLHKKVCNGTLKLWKARAMEVAYKHAHG